MSCKVIVATACLHNLARDLNLSNPVYDIEDFVEFENVPQPSLNDRGDNVRRELIESYFNV